MKKNVFKIFIFLLVNISLLSLIGCKNKGFDTDKDFPVVTSRVSGFYLNIIDVDEMDIYDDNPKVYFSYENNYINTRSGNTGYLIYAGDQRRTINEEEDYISIAALTNFYFPIDYNKKVEIYLIYQNDDLSYSIDKMDSTEGVLNSDRCSLQTTFTYKNQKYQFSLSMGLYNKE